MMNLWYWSEFRIVCLVQVALEVEEQEVVAEVRSEPLDGFMGATDDNWEEWEEWMGWEGAGATDYSSHVNPSYSF